jgi:hypothetical protein
VSNVIPFPMEKMRPVTPQRVLTGVRKEKPLAVIVVYVDRQGEMQIAACENLDDDRVVSILARAQHRIQRLLDMVES